MWLILSPSSAISSSDVIVFRTLYFHKLRDVIVFISFQYFPWLSYKAVFFSIHENIAK